MCGKTLPLNRDNFRWREDSGKPRYSPECRVCMAGEKKKAKKRAKARRNAALKEVETAGTEVFLQNVARGGSNIPHSAEVIERVMQYFGGVAGFSAMIVKQYYDSPPGGSTRSRLLETMCRLVSKNVDQGGTKKPLNLWSEEELEAELDSRFARAVASFKGITVDATQEDDQLRIAQAAEASADLLASGLADYAVPDSVRAGQHPGASGGTTGAEGGGPAALPAEPEPGEDPPEPGE
jgi:hypothetical protein